MGLRPYPSPPGSPAPRNVVRLPGSGKSHLGLAVTNLSGMQSAAGVQVQSGEGGGLREGGGEGGRRSRVVPRSDREAG